MMSSKHPREDRNTYSQVLPRCVVLVLKNKGDKRRSKGRSNSGTQFDGNIHGHGRSRSVSPAQSPTQAEGTSSQLPDGNKSTHPSGRPIFESFQSENSGCYWNPHLEESVRNLIYVGHIHPNTLLITGRDIYLDTVRNAFARRVLRPPSGFSLQKVGEMEPLEMGLIQQTQFTPLPEALCVTIQELNLEGHAATLDSVQERLHDRYKGMQAPPEEIVYETLGSLMKERKIYHTGSAGTGYFIVTPDTYKRGCFNHAHLMHDQPISTVYIPLPSPGPAEMRSISCQTEEKESTEKEEKKKGKLERSQSLKAGKIKTRKPEGLSRATSLRYTDDKAKQIFKDINLKTSDAHQDKDKGEKTSLFTKIFGRGKSRRSSAMDDSGEASATAETEYATFSAQFPPPEWACYENQTPTQQLATRGGIMPRAHTWHHMQGIPHFDASTQSDYDEEDYMQPCPLSVDRNGHRSNSNGSHSNLQVHRQYNSPSHPHELSSWPMSNSDDSRKHKPRTSSKSKCHSLRHQASPVAQNEYVEYDRDSHIYCEPSNPLNLHANKSMQLEEGGDLGAQFPNSSTPINVKLRCNSSNNDADRKTGVHSSSKAQLSPRPKSARMICYKEQQCPNFCGNDISIEYKGRMPKKNTLLSSSRDSSVNCVALKGGSSGKDTPRDKKIALLNNQTGNGNSRPNSALYINNHNRVTADTSFPAQSGHNIHGFVSSHQDSGFSSPRTDAHIAYADYHQHTTVPLSITTDNSKVSSSLVRNYKPSPTKVLHSKPPNTGLHRDSMRSERGKENKMGNVKAAFKSQDSVQITSSEKYPSYGQLHLVEEKDTTTSSSRSGSSKTTVVERASDPVVKDGDGRVLPVETTPPVTNHDATYMEIHLVSSCECPVHGESPRPSSHLKEDAIKRHSNCSKRDSKRDSKSHPGQWNHRRLSSNIHNYGSHDTSVNGKDAKGQQNNSNSRLAFLGDCEVVGFL